MDAAMGSLRGAAGSSASLNRRYAANNGSAEGNINFYSTNESYSNPNLQQQNGFNQGAYNQQGDGFSQGNSFQQSRGNTMTGYQQSPMQGNYFRSNSMQQQELYGGGHVQQQGPYRNQYQVQISEDESKPHKSHFTQMFKRKNGSKKDIREDDDDPVIMGSNEGIVSFSDISGFRKAGGPAYGVNNTSDTSPIIPTILTTGNNIDPNKMNNTAYRKMLTNQKKTALSNLNRQFKEDNGAGVPRAMSLQNQPPRAMTFQAGQNQNQQFRPQNAVPGPPPFGNRGVNAYGSRSNSLMNVNRPQGFPVSAQQQFPNKAMSMAGGNRAPFGQQSHFQQSSVRANSMQARSSQPLSYLQQQQQNQQNQNFNQQQQNQNFSQQNQNFNQQHGNSNQQHGNSNQQQQLYGNANQQQQIQQQNQNFNQQQQQNQHFNQPQNQNFSQKQQSQEHDSEEVSSQTTVQHDTHFQPDHQPTAYTTSSSTGNETKQPTDALTKQPRTFNSESSFAHKKSESIKLRPASALFKGLDENDENVPVLASPDEHHISQTNHHQQKESLISFTSPLKQGEKQGELSSNQRSFYNIKDQSDTNIFVTANELPFIDEESANFNDESASVKTDGSKKSSSGTMKKTRNFLKRMSGISSHSRKSSLSKEPASEFKVHSVVKTDVGNKEDHLKQAAMNRKNYTFKASTASASNMMYSQREASASESTISTGKVLNGHSKLWSGDFKYSHSPKEASFSEKQNRRQSYHSLFSNDDVSLATRKAQKEVVAEKHEEDDLGNHSATYNSYAQNGANYKSHDAAETGFVPKGVLDSPSSVYETTVNNEPAYSSDVYSSDVYPSAAHTLDTKTSNKNTVGQNTQKDHEKPADSSENNSALHKKLMQEIFILSEELSESIIRETELERKLLASEKSDSESAKTSSAFKTSSSISGSTAGLLDAQVELRKKSKTIVQLIKDLNEERMKRFIAEEEILNVSNGCKPDFLELTYKYDKLKQISEEKDEKISYLQDQVRYKSELHHK